MKSSMILIEMRELRDEWRQQDFQFTAQQQKRYDELLELRRARVKEMESV
jgi:hypothetical protein